MTANALQPTGTVAHQVTRQPKPAHLAAMYPPATSTRNIIQAGLPHRGLSEEVNAWRLANVPHLWRGWWRAELARRAGVATVYGAVYHTILRGSGEVVPLGLASMRLVTTVGVNFIVDAFQGTVEPEILRYHGWGTGSVAEAVGDTALGTEMTTQYNPDSTRPTGTLTEGASANIFRTVATFTPDSGGSIVLREHGIFSQAATGGGTLLDRSVFAAITLDATLGDSLQTTYELTFPSGG
jgi:hypothetical protein